MSFVRRIRKKSGVYLAEVENRRVEGKVKQTVIRYLGREVNARPVRRVSTIDLELTRVVQSLDVQVVHHLAKKLGIAELENPYWLVLAYSHLLEGHSITKLARWAEHTEIPEVLGVLEISSVGLYDSLTYLAEIDFPAVERKIYGVLSKFEKDKKAAIIDVTDTYFEGKTLPTKRRRGKDGKVRKLVQIGMAVTQKSGFPIMHKTYEGNLSNLCIFRDLALCLKERGFEALIMDRGMLSPDNLTALLKLGFETIAGLRKTPSMVKEFVAGISKDEIYQLKHRVELKNTAVYIRSFPYRKGVLIACYNPKTEYVKKEGSYRRGEQNKNDRHAGFSLIYHNTSLADREVVRQYYEKDTVERAFKQLKGVLNLRPVRVWLKNHIESHVKLCYLAYAILSMLGYKTRRFMSPVEALEQLKYGYKATIRDKKNKHEWKLSVPLKPNQQKILNAVGCSV